MNRRRAPWFADQAIPNWIDLLRRRAAYEPESQALIYSPDGEDFGDFLDFATLDRRARALAARLQERCPPGARALILHKPGLEFVTALFGCFYAGLVAVPTYPPRLARTTEDPKARRARDIARGSDATLILTERALAPAVHSVFSNIFVISSDEMTAASASDWRAPNIGPEDLAVLQYTSGSTSAPKGVMLTHGQLLANSAAIRSVFGHTAESRGLNWLPHEHDMGLIGAILQPLYSCGPTVLMPPLAFLQEPVVWLQAITRHRATTSGGPNFAYQLAADRVSDDDLAGLDLSSWEVAFVGAEPIRARTLAHFAERFAPAGFREVAFLPCYGLAESSLLVTGKPKVAAPRMMDFSRAALERGRAEPKAAGADTVALVSSGSAVDAEVRIVDGETRKPLDAGWVGEIWVRSASVAAGYFGRAGDPSFTAEILGVEGFYLRTGDLGFFLGGELFVSGRRKDVIIVDGANYFAEDIEAAVEGCHPELRPGMGAAFAVDADGSEAVAVVWETRRARTRDDAAELVRAIRAAVSRALSLPVADVRLVPPGQVPRTESGKIRRQECRRRYLAGLLEEGDRT